MHRFAAALRALTVPPSFRHPDETAALRAFVEWVGDDGFAVMPAGATLEYIAAPPGRTFVARTILGTLGAARP